MASKRTTCSGGNSAVKFVEVFPEDEAVEFLKAGGIEGKASGGAELLGDETEQVLFGEGPSS